MNELLDIWERAGVAQACEKIGLDFERIFASPASECSTNPYRDHGWLVVEQEGFTVINAIIEDAEQDRLFWEEWYLHEGEIHHHVLSLWRPPAYDELFSAPAHDEIHPQQCFSKQWYVIEDPDMAPLLLR
ncbi:MAG: hypothetical protein K9M84_12885 [Spirochaetia bacterium]|nr:hypothetical protein [Spirochaetia bacterium]